MYDELTENLAELKSQNSFLKGQNWWKTSLSISWLRDFTKFKSMTVLLQRNETRLYTMQMAGHLGDFYEPGIFWRLAENVSFLD